MRFVDLTAPIVQSPPETPEPLRTDIEFQDHSDGARQIEGLLGVPARLLRDQEGWATETFTHFGTHSSTHVDAPWHMQAQQALEGDRPGVFWAAHQADLAYSQIERLVGLDRLPPTGFKVA